MNSLQSSIKQTTTRRLCINCNKSFSSKSSLSNHRKGCKFVPVTVTMVKDEVDKMKNREKQLLEDNKRLTDQNVELNTKNQQLNNIINKFDKMTNIICEDSTETTRITKDSNKDNNTNVKYSKKSKSTVVKYKKEPISKALRLKVWELTIGNTLHGNCYCCNTKLTYNSFQAGHIIAEAKGGQTVIDNLRVICKLCNTSCGTKNLNEFKKTLISVSNKRKMPYYLKTINKVKN